MSGYTDPRVTDAATGLPPLEELEGETSLVALAWATGDGLVALPKGEPVAVRWLHVRGLVQAADNPRAVEWGQVHIAVPVANRVDVAADLAAP